MQRVPARVLYLASRSHIRGSIDLNDLHFERGRVYKPLVAYGQSKLAVILDAKEFSDQLMDTPVFALSVQPGVVNTNIQRHFSSALLLVVKTCVVDRTVPQGVATTLYACLEPQLAELSLRGSYLVNCSVGRGSPDEPNVAAQDADKKLRRALWAAAESQLKMALEKM